MASFEIGGLISGRVFSTTNEDTVSGAAKLMRKNNVSSLLITEKDKYSGIVTEKDIINKVVTEGINPEDIKVREIMSTPLITISHKESIEKAAKLMIKKEIRRLAVMDGETVVGIITETDFTKKLITFL
jgi:CBS domain-containing protein